MGVTIPDTQDYGTPVPRASTGVQSYAVAQPIQQDVAAWTYAANSAKAAADSDAAVMKETAAAVEKWSVSLDTTAAQDALNQLRGQRQELTSGESGFMRVEGGKVQEKGKDGLTMFESYPQKLQSGMEAIGGKLSSPRAQKMFREAAAAELLGYKSDVSRHGLKQTELYQGAVYKDTQAIFDNRIAVSTDPAETDLLLKKKEQAARDRANVLGLPGEAAAIAARSDGAMLVIQKAINTGDSAVAKDALTRYGGNLDAKDRIKVDGLVKTLSTDDRARSQAQMFYSGGAPTTEGAIKGTKISMEFWQAPDEKTGEKYSAPVAAGITAGFLRESQFFTGARNKGDGRDGSDSIHIGQWNAARANAFAQFVKDNNLDPNDVATGLKYAKAEIDGKIPYSISGLSPDFKARLQNAKSEKEAADIMTRGYFRPKYQDGESAHRQGSATAILAKYGGDPLAAGVSPATGVTPAAPAGKDGPDYKDPDVLLYQANARHAAATLANQEENATKSDERDRTQTYLDLMLANEKKQIDQQRLLQKNQLNEVMKTSPTDPKQIPPALWNQLSFRERESVTNIIKHNAGGKDVQITQEVMANYQTYRDMAYNDPQRFLEQDLSMLVGKLPKAHIEHLMNQREALLKDGTKPLEDSKLNSAIDVAFKGKIDTSPTASEKDKALKSMFLDDLKAWSDQFREDNKGLRPNAGQIQKYIDEKMIEHWAKGDGAPGWLERQFGAPRQSDRNVSGNKVRSVGSTPGAKYGFTLTEEERKTAVPIYAEIPKVAAQQIEKELQLNPTDQMSEAQRSAAGNYGAYSQAYKKPVEKKDVERIYGEFRRIPAKELEAIKKYLVDSNKDLSFTNIITMYREAEAREKAQAK